MAKVRVYELAKELGLESKELLAKLQEVGEFVRSASSTVEAPVVRKLMDKFPDLVPAEVAPKAKKAPAKKAAPKQTVKVEDLPPELQQMIEDATPAAPTARPVTPPAAAQRIGNNPFSATPTTPTSPTSPNALPRPPRAGNNPFSSGAGPRPPARPIRPGESGRGGDKLKPGQRPPMSGARPGSVRPGFAARPAQSNPRTGSGAPTNRPANSSSPYRTPSTSPSGAPFGGKGGGRPPQRGGAAGAFGKGGKGKGKGRGQKSKKERREDFENLPAPQLGGAVVPRGDGKTVVRMRRGATLMDFAEKIKADPAALVSALFHLGEMVTATQSVDEDTFTLLGAELGFVIQIVSPEDEDRELLEEFDINLEQELEQIDPEDLVVRSPIVTVMGHVDHGKTRLLDAIRSTEVIKSEAGGITQHIGAYQIHHDHNGTNRAITFIDTPGHEAFTAMRARGAKVTDIAVLVVAADDGVMPQTIEALNHAQAADVPIVVAVNKIDKEGANPDKIRQQLTEYNLIAEEYGGQTMFVNVSALSNKGIDELIDAILLTADAAIDLRAVADGIARGVAIEANLDKGRGPVATVLVQRGTLHVGDAIVAGGAYGRVRAMLDEHGEAVEVAGPSRPVQVLGFTSVPSAGDSFMVAEDDRTARQIAEKRQLASRNASLAKARKKVSLEDFLEQSKVSTLNLILKGDVSGSVEAVDLEQVAQVVHAGRSQAQVALLLHRRWLGIALCDDDAAQVGAVLARHVLPGFFADVVTEVNLAVLLAGIHEHAPTVVAHLDVAKLGPALRVHAHGGTQVHVHVGGAFRAHVIPPVDEVGLPLLQGALQGAVFRQVDVVGDFFAVVDTGHKSLQKLKQRWGKNSVAAQTTGHCAAQRKKHQTRF